jgi:translation initiation factor 2A
LEQFCEIERANVIDFWLSPQGSYLATWERPSKFRYMHFQGDLHTNFYSIKKAKLENGAGSNNLTIWDAKTGTEIAAFSQKAQNNW